eukprot:366278-Chlamydomonas_euryale.AAC.59
MLAGAPFRTTCSFCTISCSREEPRDIHRRGTAPPRPPPPLGELSALFLLGHRGGLRRRTHDAGADAAHGAAGGGMRNSVQQLLPILRLPEHHNWADREPAGTAGARDGGRFGTRCGTDTWATRLICVQIYGCKISWSRQCRVACTCSYTDTSAFAWLSDQR